MEHDFHRFHHTMPGLRRTGVDANAIRQVSELLQAHNLAASKWLENHFGMKFYIFLFFFSLNFPLQHYYPDGGKTHYENENKREYFH